MPFLHLSAFKYLSFTIVSKRVLCVLNADMKQRRSYVLGLQEPQNEYRKDAKANEPEKTYCTSRGKNLIMRKIYYLNAIYS